MPGIISMHLSFLKLTLFAVVTVISMATIGRKLDLSYKNRKNKWLVFVWSIFVLLVLTLSSIKFESINIAIIAIFSLSILYYFYKVLFEK
jgi:hypothetical protein